MQSPERTDVQQLESSTDTTLSPTGDSTGNLPNIKPVTQTDLKRLMKLYKKRARRLHNEKERQLAVARNKVKNKRKRKLAKAARKKNRKK